MFDLQPYRLPLAPIPSKARQALEKGVVHEAYPGSHQARTLLLDNHDAYPDGVRRAADGTALVLCTTDLPETTPAMVDWWFGWHLTDSERYKLWHPKAHLKTWCKEDRSQLSDDRAQYIGNVSYVDEYIGKSLQRLAIAFHEPSSFGFPDVDALSATAICARTSDRVLTSEGGRLIHLVVPTEHGSQMRSAFWLGEIRNQLPVVGPWVTQLVNRRALRTRLITDRFLLDLFEHCSEEMNHLPKFLPTLYRDVHTQRERRGPSSAPSPSPSPGARPDDRAPA